MFKDSGTVLFITTGQEDYLSDSVLHGLKSLHANRIVDFPKKESLYDSYPAGLQRQLYGRGFTLYRTLPDLDVDRSAIDLRLRRQEFAFVILGSIWQNYDWFFDNKKYLDPNRTLVLDGEDSPSIFPFNRSHFKKRLCLRGCKIVDEYLYFKRELIVGQSISRWWQGFLPPKYRKLHPRLQMVSFGIPEEKILERPVTKEKDFPGHVVDPEVSQILPEAGTQYRFETEADYYRDLQISRFGITTKKAGWDCLRHYEIAANGSVPCFRSLTDKPSTCAPHGLSPSNSISYCNAADLRKKIAGLRHADYERLQQGALDWARVNTTKLLAVRMLETAAGSNNWVHDESLFGRRQ